MYYQQQLCRPSSSETVLEGAERLQVQRDSVSAQHQDREDESMNAVPNKDSLPRYIIPKYSTIHLQIKHAMLPSLHVSFAFFLFVCFYKITYFSVAFFTDLGTNVFDLFRLRLQK